MANKPEILEEIGGLKMGLIRKHANNKFCELEFKNQSNFNKMSQP